MRKNKNIITEIEKRNRSDMDGFELIGPELKRKRVSQSQTLSAVASDVCSVSYLCKVEKSQLKPNKHMLKELCKRLNIESPQMNVLFQMGQLIYNSVIAYTFEKYDELERIYDKCKSFDNYKSQIVALIYFISKHKFDKANETAEELLKLINLMKNFELTIFCLFYAILMFYRNEYYEAIDNLLAIEKTEKNKDIIYLINRTLFKCYFKINHPYTIKYGNKLLEYFFVNTSVSRIEYTRYLLGLYFVYNNLIYEAENNLLLLKSEEYYNSLKFVIDTRLKRKISVNCNKLRPFMKLLYLKIFKPNVYREEFNKIIDSAEFDLDFEYNVISYLLLEDEKDKYRELLNLYIPEAIKNGNNFEKVFFVNEFCRICVKVGRYKAFTLMYLNAINEVTER